MLGHHQIKVVHDFREFLFACSNLLKAGDARYFGGRPLADGAHFLQGNSSFDQVSVGFFRVVRWMGQFFDFCNQTERVFFCIQPRGMIETDFSHGCISLDGFPFEMKDMGLDEIVGKEPQVLT